MSLIVSAGDMCMYDSIIFKIFSSIFKNSQISQIAQITPISRECIFLWRLHLIR